MCINFSLTSFFLWKTSLNCTYKIINKLLSNKVQVFKNENQYMSDGISTVSLLLNRIYKKSNKFLNIDSEP